jgi:hypothetical protein
MAAILAGSVATARQARKVRLSSGCAATCSTLGHLIPSRSRSACRGVAGEVLGLAGAMDHHRLHAHQVQAAETGALDDRLPAVPGWLAGHPHSRDPGLVGDRDGQSRIWSISQAKPWDIRQPSTTESWSATTAAWLAWARSTAQIARSERTSERSRRSFALRRRSPRAQTVDGTVGTASPCSGCS